MGVSIKGLLNGLTHYHSNGAILMSTVGQLQFVRAPKISILTLLFSSLLFLYSVSSHSTDFNFSSSAELTDADRGIYSFSWGSIRDFESEYSYKRWDSFTLSVYYEDTFVGSMGETNSRNTEVDFQLLDFGRYRFELKVCAEFENNTDDSGSTVTPCQTTIFAFEFKNDSPQEYFIKNVPPQVSFASSTDSSANAGDNFSISVAASDNTESTIPNISNLVKRVDLYLTESSLNFASSGVLLASLTSSSGGYYNFDNAKINEPGQYYLVAIAYDASNASSSAVQSITIYGETSGPVGSIETPVAQEESAEFENYQAYFGDFDGDNIDDLYFHGLAQIFLIHGQIITPIVLPAKEGFILFGKSDGSFDEVESWSMDEGNMLECVADSSCEKVSSDLLTFGDLDNDGSDDLLVQNPDASSNSVLISGSIGDLPPQIIVQISDSGHVYVKGELTSSVPVFTDNLLGSLITISGGKLIVDGQSFSIKQLTETASSIGSELAIDEKISTPNVNNTLPQSTLSTSDVVKIDSLIGVGGEFRVNEMGAATYNIPLKLPQGTAGVAPSLGMSYSSQRQSGNMGLGWQLSTPGQITRCAQNLHIDKNATPIMFSIKDRFCLDGQRLLLISGSKYGEDKSTYKTEIDSGIVVTLFSATQGRPDYFSATAKDGSTSYFGRDLDSNNSERKGYDKNDNGTYKETDKVISWHLDEFQDSVGNKITYHYSTALEFFHLSEARYAYALGSSADVSVFFDYNQRKLDFPTVVNGTTFKDNSLLQTIRIKERGVFVNQYQLVYNNGVYFSDDDNSDRLTEIFYCASEDYCSNPLTFSWGHSNDLGHGLDAVGRVGEFGLETRTTGSFIELGEVRETNYPTNFNYAGHTQLDINGDGLLDIAAMQGTINSFGVRDYRVRYFQQSREGSNFTQEYRGTVTGVGTPDFGSRLGVDVPTMFPVDVNADGRGDLAVYSSVDEEWRLLLATPKKNIGWHLENTKEPILPPNMPDNARFADLNSDGLVDVFYSTGTEFVVHYLQKRSGNESDINKSATAYSYNESAPLRVPANNFDTYNFGGIVDFNQDGKVDVLGTNIDLTYTPSFLECSYDLSFSLMQSNESGYSQMEVMPFREAVTYTLIGSKCSKGDMRRRIIGPFLNDINGDGLNDIVMAFSEPTSNDYYDPEYRFTSIQYRLGNADFSFGEEQTKAFNKDALSFEMRDVNYDDYQDLVVVLEDDERYTMLWNSNSESFDDVSSSSIAGKSENYQSRYVDMNNDGLMDLVRVNTADNKMITSYGKPIRNNVITEIQNSLGQTTKIQHKPLNASGSYIALDGISSKAGDELECSETVYVNDYDEDCIAWEYPTVVDSDAFYKEINDPFYAEDPATSLPTNTSVPAQEYISSMPVVILVGSSAPTHKNPNDMALISYRYEGLKIQAGGRGMLGFKSLMSTDLQTGVSTTTQYRQDWPFIGTPKRTVTTTKSGQILSESNSTQGILNIPESDFEKNGTASLGPLVVFTKQSEEIVYDVPEGQLVMPGEDVTGSPIKSVLKKVLIETKVDEWNNVLETVSSTYNGSGDNEKLVETISSDNAYYPGDGIRLGRLKQSEVTTNRPNVGSITRTADFTYYGYSGAQCSASSNLNGLLCSEKITVSDLTNSKAPEPTLHYYDDYGNKIFQKNGDRVSPLTVFEKGRYPLKTYDVFTKSSGESASSPGFNYSAPTGSVIVQTSEVLVRNDQGIPILSRTYLGDKQSVFSAQKASPLGVVYFKGDSTGNFEETRRKSVQGSADSNCPANTAVVQSVSQAGGTKASVCTDKVGREIGSYAYTLQGGIIRTETRYDTLGRVVEISDPKVGAPTNFTTTIYDILGRPKKTTHSRKITNVSGDETSKFVETSISYDGYAVTTTTSGISGQSNRVKKEVNDALGQLVSVTEQGSRTIKYDYDVLGNLETVTDPLDKTSTINYNGLAQKISMSDPDKGDWSYRYNTYGELVEQTDAKKQTSVIQYDFKGRKTLSKTYAAGVNTNSGKPSIEQEWTYDSAKYGLGQMARENDISEQHSQQYEYDTLGRTAYTVTSMPNHTGDIERFYQRQTYDEYGRVYQTFDGARVGPQFSYNGIQNVYNSRGFLIEVRDAANDGEYFYVFDKTDARGNVTEMHYGDANHVLQYQYNELTGLLENIVRKGFFGDTSLAFEAKWDHLGNLASRKDGLYGSKAETFAYDEHNRLTSNTLDGTTVSVKYNKIDNIINKSDLPGEEDYVYHPTKVHAVIKVGSRALVYDSNGNATKDGDKTLTYSVKDQAIKIVTPNHTSEFNYGVGGSRFKRIDTNSEGKQTATLYLGSVEKVYNADGSIVWKRNIGGKVQILHTQAANGAVGTGKRQYLLHDHLGSVAAITNSVGDITQRMAYDPWGARRKITSNQWQAASMDPLSGLTAFYKANKPDTNRGFTGHEMLDEVGIIHMNGRIYDATLGRFLQADPFIQAPTMVGSLNRYSYVLNNPLNKTDPTGYLFGGIIGDVFKLVAIAAVTYFTAGAAAGWALAAYGSSCAVACSLATASLVSGIAGGAAAGFVGGALGTLASGGDIGDAFKNGLIGAVSGAAFGGIGAQFTQSGGFLQQGGLGHISSHGLVGGVSNVLQGGKFGHGFFSAGFAKFSGAHLLGGVKGTHMGSVLGRSTIAGMVGGTVSQLTGGKFANGARTAALAHLVNQEGKNIKAFAKKVFSIDNTRGALTHYFYGNGEDVELGPNTKSAIKNSEDQLYRSYRIRNGLTSDSDGFYGVNVEFSGTRDLENFHIGDTPIHYSTACDTGQCTTTYTSRGDGFWDPFYNADGIGPKGEVGKPFNYKPFNWSETYPDPN